MALNQCLPIVRAPCIHKFPRPSSPPRQVQSDESIFYNTSIIKSSVSCVQDLLVCIRRQLRAKFIKSDESDNDQLISIDAYKAGCERAFRFYTRTSTISREAFYHKTCKMGIHVNSRICGELFDLLDTNTLGEIDMALFTRGLLPFTEMKSDHDFQLPAKVEAVNRFDQEHRVNQTRLKNLFDKMSVAELGRLLATKLEAKSIGSADHFRQSFRFFSTTGKIKFEDFQARLEQLQIFITLSKCRELFEQFDANQDGEIDLSEFTDKLMVKDGFAKTEDATRSRKAPAVVPPFAIENSESLTLDRVLDLLHQKFEQYISSERDLHRKAFELIRKSSDITLSDLINALHRLGLRVSRPVSKLLFEYFDCDYAGALDLSKLLGGIRRHGKSSEMAHATSNSDRVVGKERCEMVMKHMQRSWTMQQIEQMLRGKIEQRTSKSSDCFRQAFRIFKKVNGIKLEEFHTCLRSCGLTLTFEQSKELFERYDRNNSGDIDLNEFIHGVLPPDYTGHQCFLQPDSPSESQKRTEKKGRVRDVRHHGNEVILDGAEYWSLDDIEAKIRDKVEQATRKNSDTFRQAFKFFEKTHGITLPEFRDRLIAIGFRLTDAQYQGLFKRYDLNNSNDLDLQEFCLAIKPSDYNGEGDYWSHTDQYREHKRQQLLDHVNRTKNGLLVLPRFKQKRKFARYNHKEDSTAYMEHHTNGTSSISEINKPMDHTHRESTSTSCTLVYPKTINSENLSPAVNAVLSPRTLKAGAEMKSAQTDNESKQVHLLCTPRRPAPPPRRVSGEESDKTSSTVPIVVADECSRPSMPLNSSEECNNKILTHSSDATDLARQQYKEIAKLRSHHFTKNKTGPGVICKKSDLQHAQRQSPFVIRIKRTSNIHDLPRPKFTSQTNLAILQKRVLQVRRKQHMSVSTDHN
uniref:Uncharacterized protein AlNc14C3G378 n=1 Tax=Albugo laibachii Nc14 TaxID=890382 RepID=F0VZP9_9STRA|nr:conserved hypothetical protein [Albugo laibachii Nc14]|eukprot:CCA14270.1 conserved hypothetical protein [Albugo laibachii Nc14]